MNIGIVTTWFERGAAYVSKQLEKTLSNIHNVYIYARGGEKYAIGNPEWDKPNVTWGKRTLLSRPTTIYLNDFEQWIKKYNIELVIFNEQHEWQPLSICHKLNIKIGSYIDYYKKETVPFFNAYDFLICNTKRHFSVFKWHPQCIYIPWGTDTSLFFPRNKKNNQFTFFHSSGLNPYRKGTDLLIKATYKLMDKPFNTIIHTQSDLLKFFPNMKNIIKYLIRNKKLEIIQKTVSQPGLYNLGNVYVYPSRLDGIGLTIAEAIASGLPVLVTNDQPMNEFVGNHSVGDTIKVKYSEKRGDGYYWPQSIVDEADLCNKMLKIYKNYGKYNYTKYTREYALKFLDWDKNSRPLNHILPTIKLLDANVKNDALMKAINYDKSIPLKKQLMSTRICGILRNNFKTIISYF